MGKLIDNVEFEVEYGAVPNHEFPRHDGWTCTFYYDGEEMTVPFYMGSGHHGRQPDKIEVLDCLFRDGDAVDMEDFDEFCMMFNYNNDSIKDLRTYEACVKIGHELKNLFGEDYEDIRAEIEELEL